MSAEKDLGMDKPGARGDSVVAGLVNSIPVGLHFYRLEADNRLIFLGSNPAATAILGTDRGDYIGKTIEETFPALANTDIPDHYRQVARGRGPWNAEQIAYQDGEIAGAFAVHAFQTGPHQMVAAFWDLTQRVRQQAVLERRAQQLILLNQIGAQIVSTLSVETILRRTVQLAQERFGYQHVGIFTVDESDLRLHLRSVAGAYVEQYSKDYSLAPGEGMVGWVAQQGRYLLSNDVSQEPRYVNHHPGSVPTCSELVVPILLRDQVLGVLDIQSPSLDAFDDQDVLVMETLAGQVAVALENARLYHIAQASEERYRRLVESSPGAIFVYLDGRFAFVNQAGLRLMGATEEKELLGMPILERIHPNYRDTVRSVVRSTYDSAVEAPLVEVKFIRLDGVPVDVAVSAIPLQHAGRLAVQFVAHDITARLQADQELRARREFLETLTDLAQTALESRDMTTAMKALADRMGAALGADHCYITIWDKEKQQPVPAAASGELHDTYLLVQMQPGEPSLTALVLESGRPIAVSNARNTGLVSARIARMFPAQALLGLPLQAGGVKLGAVLVAYNRVREFTPQELKHGEQMAALVSLALAKLNLLEETEQRAQQMQHLQQDLREQLDVLRKTQARLVQSEKLAAIGELVAGVAHELNNPLTSVVLYAQLLQSQPIHRDAARSLDMIVSEAQRASKIVRGLLEFARRRTPERRAVQINHVLTGALDLLGYELRTHNVELSLNLDPDLPITMADPHQLQQVFVNIITNSWQAMQEPNGAGGRLWVSTEQGQPAYYSSDGSQAPVIKVTFRDNGPGITSAALAHIFDPFFTTKPVGQGTGLGLSICHGIIHEHGGEIWAESEADAGTTFFVELPITAPQEIGATATRDNRPETEGRAVHMLLVDDENSITTVVQVLLQRNGYLVDIAENGQQALDLIGRQLYDLILCDIRMPGMSGLDFYERVQQAQPDLASRIIFMTGDSASPAIRLFLEKAELTCLDKPFDLKQLQVLVADTLAKAGRRSGVQG